MSCTEKVDWKDRVWIGWLTIHLFVILLVDAVPFYPEELRVPPAAPLHFLERLRNYYIATFNDPIVQWTSDVGHDNWIPLFFHIEMLFLLPVCMYTVYSQGFGNRKVGFTGPEELLYLIYAFVTAFTTLVCVNDVFYWDDAIYDHKAKSVFLWQLYGPWVLIPGVMFYDMYSRLLRRLRASEAADVAVAVKKKTQ